MSYTRQSILFISGLDKTVNENMLYQLFNEFPISYIKIAKEHLTRESFGYAFVGLKNQSKAEEAISKLNYSKLNKKTLRISWYNREPNNFRNHSENNIFVKRISKEVTHQEFHDLFIKFGNIVSVKLAEDEDGELMGYGFVLYDSGKSAENAIHSSNGMEWKGKRIFVSHFIKRKPRKAPRFNNIYVKNIPKSLKKEDIEKLFSKYGAIGSTLILEPDASLLSSNLPSEKKAQIMNHKFAFVCFLDLDGPAQRAVNEVPYYKLSDASYNQEIDQVVELLKKVNVEESNLHKGAAYLLDYLGEDSKKLFVDDNFLNEQIQNFRNILEENEGLYIVRDKTDRIDCCQALKKNERAKIVRRLYEKIKRKIREKYKFCNLYIKNLPDNFDEDGLKRLFDQFGKIRSAKIMKRDIVTSYLGMKRSVNVFGFVCFYDPRQAREAKLKLDKTVLIPNGPRLYVDYHQTKQERSEYMKLKLLSKSGKVVGARPKPELHPALSQIAPLPTIFDPQLHPNYAPRSFMRPDFLPRPPFALHQIVQQQLLQLKIPPMDLNAGSDYNGETMRLDFLPRPPFQLPQIVPQQIIDIKIPPMDPNTRADYYGEKLYAKISSDPNFAQNNSQFSKIVGIFLDLEDSVLERLLNDDKYFILQVKETIRLLNEKVSLKICQKDKPNENTFGFG